MSNSIGELNERVQRDGGHHPPVYSAARVGGDDHCPLWKASVSVGDRLAEGETVGTSKMAKQSAAAAWLRQWPGHYAGPRRDTPPHPAQLPLPAAVPDTRPKLAGRVYLDMENRPKDIDALIEIAGLHSEVRVVAYAASKWPALAGWIERAAGSAIEIRTIDSGVASAADVLIVCEVVRALTEDADTPCVVISGDGMFYALRDAVKQVFPGATLTHLTRVTSAASVLTALE